MAASEGGSEAWLEVWAEPVHRWRWGYLIESGQGKRLMRANENYPSREEAAKAARSSYPGVRFAGTRSGSPARQEPEEPSRRRRLLGVALVAALALAAVWRWRRRGGPDRRGGG